MLWRNTFRFTLLNAFAASTISIAWVSCSLNISRIACTAASQPASWPAQTCNEPTDFIIESLLIEITALPMTLLRISPTPIGRRPGNLFNGIRRHARRDSRDELRFPMVHSFLATNAIELQRLVEQSLKELPSNILFHPSESIPEGPDPPVVLIIALLILSAVRFSKITGCICFGLSGNNTLSCGRDGFGCFCFNIRNVSSFNGKIPFYILSDKSFRALLIFPFCIRFANSLDISPIDLPFS